MSKDKLHSRAWLGGYADLFERETKAERMSRPEVALVEANIEKVIRLAHAKRAVGNFVRIVTNQNIPVRYATSGDSKTDGCSVVLNANITDKTFDAVVGTALHEAAHVKLSDFRFLRTWASHYATMLGKERINVLLNKGYNLNQVRDFVHLMMNVIEDRRIDQWMYQRAPGYRPYYAAMYKSYWASKEIDRMLLSDIYTTPTLSNYINRLMNISNKNFRTDALPVLDKCVQIIDLPNIARLNAESANTTLRFSPHGNLEDPEYVLDEPGKWTELLRLAIDVLDTITPYLEAEKLPPPPAERGKSSEGSGMSMGGSSGEPDEDSSGESSAGSDDTEDDSDSDSDEDSEGSGGGTGSGGENDSEESSDSTDSEEADSDADEGDEKDSKSTKDEEKEKEPDVNLDHLEDALSSEINNPTPPAPKIDKKKLEKAIADQKKFLDGNIKKSKLTATLSKEVESIAQADASIAEVGSGCFDGMVAKCIITRRLTSQLIGSKEFPFSSGYAPARSPNDPVATGIRLGNMLASKLAVRNDSSSLKYTRQNRGHVDKRLLAQLGAGIESIFHNFKTDQFRNVFLHLTLDASSSMNGVKWERTITCATAICRAAELIRNIDVTVSIRAGGNDRGMAHIAFIYDSRRDSTRMIQSLWPSLRSFGNTPEGLTFEAILDELVKEATHDKDLYFINISDGAPSFQLIPNNAKATRRRRRTYYGGSGGVYAGAIAAEHTRSQVKLLEDAGFKIMSYYISDTGSHYYSPSSESSSKSVFTRSYGPAAQFIDIVNLGGLIKTLNKLFLSKAK